MKKSFLALLCTLTLFSHWAAATDANARLLDLLEDYVEESLRENPLEATALGYNAYNNQFLAPISAQQRAESRQQQEDYLARLLKIPLQELDSTSQQSWKSFEFDRRAAIAGFEFPSQFLPLNQLNGWHVRFPGYAQAGSIQPFASVADYDAFLQRAQGFAAWMDSAVLAMQEGMARGYTQPRHIVEKILPQLRSQIVQDPQSSPFYSAINAMPASFDNKQRQRLTRAYRYLVVNTLVPAYQRMLSFLEGPYLRASRDSIGYSDLPGGATWYQWQIYQRTTLSLSAEEIHATGRKEVARIREAMGEVMHKVEFEGDLQAFFSHLRSDDQFFFESDEALLAGYRETLADIRQRLPRLFNVFPTAPLEVRTVDPWLASAAAGASYQSASPDGSRPGVFYINTYNLRAQPRFGAQTLSLHEALPGHYFQGTLQLENTELPRYRRYNSYQVYSEGWAMYAESLGPELGLFTDPYDWYGRLNDEQLRAMRLVVDTGLHAMNWSREQAIDYMLDNSSLARSDVEAEVDRYIVWPGQALAYKVGEHPLQELRRGAETALGAPFDISAFHR